MKDKRNCHDTVGKSSSDQHFHKSAAIPLSCEIFGTLQLVQLGLMAAGWLISKLFLKISCGLKYSSFCFV